jgi:hypothetical protein
VTLVWNGISQAESYQLVWNILGQDEVIIDNIEENTYVLSNLQKA